MSPRIAFKATPEQHAKAQQQRQREDEHFKRHPNPILDFGDTSFQGGDMQHEEPKYQADDLGHGWTRFRLGKGRGSVTIGNAARPDLSLSMADLRVLFDGKMREWLASECRKETVRIIREQQASNELKIDKAVCIGLESFSRRLPSWEGQDKNSCEEAADRSLLHLAAFYDIVHELDTTQNGNGAEIKVIVDEPMFSLSQVDVDFLHSLNISVCEFHYSDQGLRMGHLNHLYSNTFVFETGALESWALSDYTTAVGYARPALVVGWLTFDELEAAKVKQWLELSPGKWMLEGFDERREMERKLLATHEWRLFPDFEGDADEVRKDAFQPWAFRQLAICWKKGPEQKS